MIDIINNDLMIFGRPWPYNKLNILPVGQKTLPKEEAGQGQMV